MTRPILRLLPALLPNGVTELTSLYWHVGPRYFSVKEEIGNRAEEASLSNHPQRTSLPNSYVTTYNVVVKDEWLVASLFSPP